MLDNAIGYAPLPGAPPAAARDHNGAVCASQVFDD
jgi:hypothetical protein